jgi:hypothetical protein
MRRRNALRRRRRQIFESRIDKRHLRAQLPVRAVVFRLYQIIIGAKHAIDRKPAEQLDHAARAAGDRSSGGVLAAASIQPRIFRHLMPLSG